VFKGYDAGAVDFMVKPYNPKILLSKISVFLSLDRQKMLLKQSKDSLALANETLERKVGERTQKLETAIADLKIEIKKRVQAEKQSLNAKKEWQEIFEAVGQMTMILDKDHTIISANRAVLEYTGLPLTDITGQKCHSIFHHTDHAVNDCPVSNMMNSGQFNITEAEIETMGKTFIISCTPVFDDRGNLEKIIHIATDITRQRQLKKELIQAHKMEAIGSLAGGIAHDFNNILSAVLGYAELALKDVEKGSQIQKDLQQIYSAGTRARDLVKQILNFARQTDEELKPVRIDIIAKEVAKFLGSTIPSTIEIIQNLNSRSLVLSNPVKIHQLIMNLCTNAAHAMNEGGELTISLHEVTLEWDDIKAYGKIKPGHYQKMEISDTGAGIPEEIVDSIFLPFFTTKGIHEGTGMGLAMVHSIVKECSGHVSVNSQKGKGSVFTILLPITDAQEKTKQIIDARPVQSGSAKILIIDDELSICKLSSRLLQGYGYKAVFETDSEKALALFSERPNEFDLVITDMTMPKIAGDVLTRKILAIRPDMPVIIATGYSKILSEKKAVKLGVRAVLSKPFEKNNLIKIVQDVLGKE